MKYLILLVLIDLTLVHAEPAARDSREAPAVPVAKQDVVVYQEELRYGGWPANQGIWSWQNEVVVGFTAGWYKPVASGHAIDFARPQDKWQARSLDGGMTWTVEKPFAPVMKGVPPAMTRLSEPLDFTAAGFALMFQHASIHTGPSWFYASTDRCHTWSGPHELIVDGIDQIAARTDCLVLGRHECLMFGSAAKADGKEGRVFCARTTDGGMSWKLHSLIGDEPEGYAIMPSSLRLKSGALLTTIRRRDPKIPAFIEAWRSEDLGVTWQNLGQSAPDIGSGNPPSLVALPDGRLCLTYGFRAKPNGIRARISADEGRTWGEEIILRDDGLTGDLGYPRSITLPDGSVLTTYYFNGPRPQDRAIEATLWKP